MKINYIHHFNALCIDRSTENFFLFIFMLMCVCVFVAISLIYSTHDDGFFSFKLFSAEHHFRTYSIYDQQQVIKNERKRKRTWEEMTIRILFPLENLKWAHSVYRLWLPYPISFQQKPFKSITNSWLKIYWKRFIQMIEYSLLFSSFLFFVPSQYLYTFHIVCI